MGWQHNRAQERRLGKAKLQYMLEAAKNQEISELAVEHLAAGLRYYAALCNSDPSNMEKWMDKRMAVAVRLAPYQSPTFQAISVTGNQQDQAKLAQMSDAELAMALKERAESWECRLRYDRRWSIGPNTSSGLSMRKSSMARK